MEGGGVRQKKKETPDLLTAVELLNYQYTPSPKHLDNSYTENTDCSFNNIKQDENATKL